MENIDGMYSIKEIYRLGRGPSSSHTMGPSAACEIVLNEYPQADAFRIVLYGSMAKTGIGHRTDYAIRETLKGKKCDIILDEEQTELLHPNTLEITALKDNKVLCTKTVRSVGGGAIEFDGEQSKQSAKIIYQHTSFADIEAYCKAKQISLADYVFSFENLDIKDYLLLVWNQMKSTINSGLSKDGIIPGGLDIKRKAKMLLNKGKSKAFGHEKEIYLL